MVILKFGRIDKKSAPIILLQSFVCSDPSGALIQQLDIFNNVVMLKSNLLVVFPKTPYVLD